jgi:hypothetical protein
VTEASIPLAHGVGQIYESPIPLYLYLVGAAATVAVSFLLQSLRGPQPREPRDRLIAGPRAARAIRFVLQAAGIVGLTLALVAGVVVRSEGLTLTTLLFWVGLIVGMIVLSALVSGVWEATDPWTTLEDVYRLEDAPVKERRAPWWITPLALYGLFWFELVSDVGFVDFWIVMVLLGYSLAVFSFRGGLGRAWQQRDPLSVLFSFAGRLAPLKLTDGGVFAKSPVADLAAGGAMPPALFASVFVLLSSTTFDNVGETIAWGAFLTSTGLIDVPPIIVNSLALALFSVLFVVPYIASVTVAHRWTATRLTLRDAALTFGWALVPIGIAYVLAHNAGLLFTGVPVLIRSLSDPFGFGWNLLGTAHLFEGYIVSPALVWFVQIALIVGGHILGVLVAHRIAVPLAGTHRDAVRSEYALTALMCVYTISTLWLLAQPLVSS